MPDPAPPILTPDQRRALIVGVYAPLIKRREPGAVRRMKAHVGNWGEADQRILDAALSRLDMEQAVKRQRGAQHELDRKAAAKAQHNQVERRPCADPARRRRLEMDDAAWMRYYMHDSFYLPFEKPHFAIIEETRAAIDTRRDVVVAAERGVGKSYIGYAMVFKLAITGEQAFPVRRTRKVRMGLSAKPSAPSMALFAA
jgi:hypothetical protein